MDFLTYIMFLPTTGLIQFLDFNLASTTRMILLISDTTRMILLILEFWGVENCSIVFLSLSSVR
jgi:hypothetical protein